MQPGRPWPLEQVLRRHFAQRHGDHRRELARRPTLNIMAQARAHTMPDSRNSGSDM
jgi:hypothetical protein